MRALTRACLLLVMPSALGGCAIFKPTTSDSGAADGGAADGGAADGGAADGGAADGGAQDGGADDGGAGDGGTGDGGDPDGGADGGGDGGGDDSFCDDGVTTPRPADTCVTETISCGETITATLVGGKADYGAEDYEAWYCTYTSGDPWSGPERVYAFEHPGTGTVELELHSPCAELDLGALRWGWWASDGECPTEASSGVSECEFDDSAGGGSVSIYAIEPSAYLVFVDGVEGVADAFQLTANCP